MKKGFIILFLAISVALSGVILASPDKTFSENENRNLKIRADISKESFQNDVEEFFSDQFPFRENIAVARAKLAVVTGKRDINGAYVGRESLFQKITESEVDRDACIRYADKINKLADSIETYVIYVPSAGAVHKSELPKFAQMYDYHNLLFELSERLGNARIVQLGDIEYYRTDHHWTAEGAYSAYISWSEAHSSKPEKFEYQTVSEDFRGTLYSKALINIPPDTIKAPVIHEEITVYADGQEIELYDSSALDGKDKYNYFQGGNHGIVTIENKNQKNGKILLILKDSFANSFVPYIVGDYQKIIMLDERYTFVSPKDIIDSEKVTELAVIKEIIS